MGFLGIQIVTLLTTLSVGLPAGADANAPSREFSDYRCKLVLPGPQFHWLDPGQIRNAQAALSDDAGTVLTFLVSAAPRDFAFDSAFICGFDGGFQQPEQIRRIDAGMTTFHGLPCYQVHARLKEGGLFVTQKCFAANGCLYTLQLLSRELPARDSPLEKVFSAFQFVGLPTVPQSLVTSEPPTYHAGLVFGALFGFIVAGLAVVLIVWQVTQRRPPRVAEAAASPAQAPLEKTA